MQKKDAVQFTGLKTSGAAPAPWNWCGGRPVTIQTFSVQYS